MGTDGQVQPGIVLQPQPQMMDLIEEFLFG